MNEHAFIFGGRRYHITSQFDAGSALSAARRLRVLASYLDDGAPFAGDPTTLEDGWLLSDVLSRVERSNDDGEVYRMACGERLHPELERAPMRDAVALFEHAARHVAIAQLDALSPDYCGKA
jgi:hypothetical protein